MRVCVRVCAFVCEWMVGWRGGWGGGGVLWIGVRTVFIDGGTRLSKDTLEQSSSANSSPSNFVVDSIKSPMVRSSLTVTASTSTHGLKKRPSEKLSIKSPPRKCISVPPTRSFVKPKITMFMSNQKSPSNQLSVQTGTFNHRSDTSTGDINDTVSSMYNDEVVEEKNNSTGIITDF